MRKGIIIAISALCAAAALPADLNPPGDNVCGAGTMYTDPSTIEGENEFDLIYDNLSVKIGDGEVWLIRTDDGDWWSSGTMTSKTYGYMMVKFEKPQGYDGGTLNWQIGLDEGAVVYAYRWNKTATPHEWDYIDSNDGGFAPGADPEQPAIEHCSIPSSYFDANGELWLLFKGAGGPDLLKCDVVDIHW